MRKNYNFKKMKFKPNPYLKLLKKPTTIRFDQDVIEYFKNLGIKEGIPYQTLVNQYLRYCIQEKLSPLITWKKIV